MENEGEQKMEVKVNGCVVAGENIPKSLTLVLVEKLSPFRQVHGFAFSDDKERKVAIKQIFKSDRPIEVEL